MSKSSNHECPDTSCKPNYQTKPRSALFSTHSPAPVFRIAGPGHLLLVWKCIANCQRMLCLNQQPELGVAEPHRSQLAPGSQIRVIN